MGLPAALTDLDARSLLDGTTIFQEFKGALTEQYVLQQLMEREDFSTYYWTPDNSPDEIDFLIQYKGEVIPIEVKLKRTYKPKAYVNNHPILQSM
ncbi:DUF4143 domain-containing protein [Sphingobacterium thalpophilum]|uniref:DUF4143 domain-containing protein n=1 Tax=Sphingobacterium thalpophilum TaxID=259 RepID=UPI002D78F1BF|nr:DUF4143 domain-containing protein [Sphingobacterium thalpophilum]